MLLSEFEPVSERIVDPREAIIRRALEIIDQDMKNDPRKVKPLERYAFDVWRAVGLKNMTPRDLVALYQNWKDVTEGVGRITAQNKTADVGYDAITKEAAKFGNKVDRDGRPPLLRVNESIDSIDTGKDDKFGIRFEDLKSGFKSDGETKLNAFSGSNNTDMSKTLESRLNEIESVSLGKDWGEVSRWRWNGKNSDRVFKIGRVLGLNLVIEKGSYKGSMTAYLMNKEGDAVGEIQLEKEYNAWITDTTILKPEYQGQGLMLQAYVALAKAGMILRSGGSQSAGGKKIWLALNKQPGITVYAGKEGRDGEWKYSAIDDDEVDDRARGAFDIYDVDNHEVDNEYKSEVFALQARVDKLSAQALRATSTAEKAKFTQEYEEANDMLAKLEDERVKANRAQRAKDTAHDWEDTYLFAVADGVEPNNRF